MTPNYEWTFESNEVGVIEGPRHPGMVTFEGDRATTVIREAIQNSLDARVPGSRDAVLVSFQRTDLSKELLATDSLSKHLQYAVESHHNTEEIRPVFERAKLFVEGEGKHPVVSLCISDRNTTGALDYKMGKGKPTPWDTLTKGDGLTNKTQKDAAGSFGIGKFASFVATPLRTVLYSTAFYNADNVLSQRFLGKTILVSHEDNNGEAYRRTGYLGNKFRSLENNNVPEFFRLDQPGTSLYIPGYNALEGGFTNWEKESTSIALKNYFHAIIHGRLEIQIGERLINKETYDQYLREMAEHESIHNLARVSSFEPYASDSFPHIGEILVSIDVHKDNRQREIALVRDAGMLITTDRRKMSLNKLARIPAHWWGFTAIIDVRSNSEALLKQAESPRHDSIGLDFIGDEEWRAKAHGIFEEIGNWCYDKIKKVAEPDFSADQENVNELADYLSLDGDDHHETGEEEPSEQGKSIVTMPVQSFRPPRRPRDSRGVKQPTDTIDNSGKDTPPPNSPGPGRQGRGRRVVSQPRSFVGTRFKPKSGETHAVVVTFDQPDVRPSRIEILAVGEDGTTYPMGIRRATVGDLVLKVDDNLFSLPDAEPGSRREIEIYTREPIINKTFSIRFFEESK